MGSDISISHGGKSALSTRDGRNSGSLVPKSTIASWLAHGH
jgi:hypothetical protein